MAEISSILHHIKTHNERKIQPDHSHPQFYDREYFILRKLDLVIIYTSDCSHTIRQQSNTFLDKRKIISSKQLKILILSETREHNPAEVIKDSLVHEDVARWI
jgi:hypothetical protein